MKKVYTKKELREIPLIKVFNQAGIHFCPTCKKGYFTKEEIESIENAGECTSCDHARGEQLYDQNLPF